MDLPKSGRQKLMGHFEDCTACRAEQLPVDSLDALLAGDVPLDASALSRSAVWAARPVLQANASRALVWRTFKAVLISLAPMVLVVGYDLLLLDLMDGILTRFLSPALATYIVSSYLVLISLALAVTYAAIPLLLAGRIAPQSRFSSSL